MPAETTHGTSVARLAQACDDFAGYDFEACAGAAPPAQAATAGWSSVAQVDARFA